jgi:hypothetical protein
MAATRPRTSKPPVRLTTFRSTLFHPAATRTVAVSRPGPTPRATGFTHTRWPFTNATMSSSLSITNCSVRSVGAKR